MEELADTIRRLHESGPVEKSERRRGNRVRRKGAICIQIAGQGLESQTLTVQFRDCSETGIGFTAELSMEPGAKFDVVIRHPERGDLVLSYQVVRCDQVGPDVYDIGAKLMR